MSRHRGWFRQMETVVVAGRIATDGSAIPLTTGQKGKGFTITRTGVGTYRCTLDTAARPTTRYPRILGAFVSAVKSGVDVNVVVTSIDETNQRFDFVTFSQAGAAADNVTSGELCIMLVAQATSSTN